MSEYIKREDAIEEIMSEQPDAHYPHWYANKIKSIPVADVAPVRHGKWIDAYPDIEPNPMFMYGICSECGFEQGISKYLKYCPDCGCRMDGGAD